MGKKEGHEFRESFDRNFQNKLVRLLFQKPENIGLVRSNVRFEFFETKMLQWIVGRLYYAHDKRFRPTMLHMKKELRDAIEYGVVEKNEHAEYKDFIRRLKRPVPEGNWIQEKIGDFVRQSRLKVGILKTAVALDEEGDTEKALAELHQLNSDLRNSTSTFDPTEFSKFTHDYMEVGPGKILTGIPTGLPRIDKAMGGHRGMPPKRLGSVMANSGSGKTLLLTQFGSNAIRHFAMANDNKVVLHLTGEDDTEAMFYRYMASVMGVPFKVLKRKKYLRQVRKAYKITTRSLGKRWQERIVVREFEDGELSVSDIDGMCHMLESIGKEVGMVIVDYADLLRPRKAKEDMYSHIGNIYKELRDLAKRRSIPIWTASQVKTVSQGKKFLGPRDVEGSGKKIFVSDVVLMLQQTDKEKSKGRGRLAGAKIRFGKDKFEFPVKIDYPMQRVLEAA